MSDQIVADAATFTTHNKHKRRTFMSSAGFETAISVYLINTQSNAHIFINDLKFTLKHLKRSYVFRSCDHSQRAYIVCALCDV